MLQNSRFMFTQQCQNAANNAPAMMFNAKGSGVAAVQKALIDMGFPMPLSVKRFGVPDGVYGNETVQQMKAFQKRKGLTPDGVTGKNTMQKLDDVAPDAPPDQQTGLPFKVPGFLAPVAQPTSMVCWATVHAMMRSWKTQQSKDIRQAAAAVAEKYGVLVDQNKGLPSAEFGPFINAAGMALEPMMNLTIDGWVGMLRSKGLIWVGTLNSIGPGAGLHSRIIEAMSGDGSVDGTFMHIVDPDGGRRYKEVFRTFLVKYEGAFGQASGDYFQIRHFR